MRGVEVPQLREQYQHSILVGPIAPTPDPGHRTCHHVTTSVWHIISKESEEGGLVRGWRRGESRGFWVDIE